MARNGGRAPDDELHDRKGETRVRAPRSLPNPDRVPDGYSAQTDPPARTDGMESSARLDKLSKRIPLAILTGIAGMIAQGYYAGHRTLPHFLDQDASGRFGTPGASPIHIVAIGDSTMTGPGLLDPADLWLRQAIDRLDPVYEVELHVLAKGGAWTKEIREEQTHRALTLRPDIAVVSGGSNDSIRGVPLRRIRSDLTYIAGALAEIASTVILTGVGDMGSILRLPQPLATALKWRSRARRPSPCKGGEYCATHCPHSYVGGGQSAVSRSSR